MLGIHIRRGDACPMLPMMNLAAGQGARGAARTSLDAVDTSVQGHQARGAGRFCPQRLDTSYGYWMRQFQDRYGVNAVYLATDSTEAEQWCKDITVPGKLDCHTIALNRTALMVRFQ